MSVRNNMLELLQQSRDCRELLDAGPLDAAGIAKVHSVLGDLSGIVSSNLDLIADAHGG